MVLHIYEPKRDPAGFPMQIFKSDTFETIAYPRKQKTLKITRIIRVLGLAYLVGPGGFEFNCSNTPSNQALRRACRSSWIRWCRRILLDYINLSRRVKLLFYRRISPHG